MMDYISREAVKLHIFEYGINHRDNGSIASACENLERQINSLPAADVREVKKGKWKETGRDHIYSVCPICREPYSKLDFFGEKQNRNFCPNCGADMRGTDDAS